MAQPRNRVEVMHGVNLDQLGRRDPAHYGALTLDRARAFRSPTRRPSWVSRRASSRPTTRASSSSTCTACDGLADGIVLNPGAWTHYSYAIRDALELTGLPAVEVHLSDVDAREPWRRESVIRELCIGRDRGQGPRRLPSRRSSCCERS